MKIAVFQSHPIQHFSPLWREVSAQGNTGLKVFYYSRQGLEAAPDAGFGCQVKWDVDLLEGYESEFLPRAWLTRSETDCSWRGLNRGFSKALQSGYDLAYVSGYAHLNHWRVTGLCRRFGIPLLYHSDSNIIHERTKSRAWRILKRVLLRRFFQKVTLFLASGDNNAAYLKMYGVPADRISFCPIPVDLARFERELADFSEQERLALRAQYGLGPSDFVVGFCGKLISRKRAHDLIAAAALCHLEDLRVLFVGSGEMEQHLKARGHPQSRFAGFVNQAAIPRLLAACDVLAMPSDYDPHPIVVTEAQSLGLPVLLSDRCGCYGPNDVFRDGESGILYECGNVPKLAAAIRALRNDPELRRKMGRRARQLAETQSVAAAASLFLQAAEKAGRVFQRA